MTSQDIADEPAGEGLVLHHVVDAGGCLQGGDHGCRGIVVRHHGEISLGLARNRKPAPTNACGKRSCEIVVWPVEIGEAQDHSPATFPSKAKCRRLRIQCATIVARWLRGDLFRDPAIAGVGIGDKRLLEVHLRTRSNCFVDQKGRRFPTNSIVLLPGSRQECFHTSWDVSRQIYDYIVSCNRRPDRGRTEEIEGHYGSTDSLERLQPTQRASRGCDLVSVPKQHWNYSSADDPGCTCYENPH